MDTLTIDLHEAQAHLSELVIQVQAGVEVVLTEGAIPVARLVPIEETIGDRLPGLHPGNFTNISDDFDAPLPDEFWLGSA